MDWSRNWNGAESMPTTFWLARAREGRAARQLELYCGATGPVILDGHWDTRGRCYFVGPVDKVVCSGFSVEPGECVQAEIGLMSLVERKRSAYEEVSGG